VDIHEQMEKISISVTKNVAKAWETASQEAKNKIAELIEKQISPLLSEPKNRKEVLEYIQSLQNEMSQKGLTQEILDDLLK
jgi:enterochelin esterase-like enzyme